MMNWVRGMDPRDGSEGCMFFSLSFRFGSLAMLGNAWQFMHGLFDLLLRERPEDPYEFMVPSSENRPCRNDRNDVVETLDLPRPNALARQPRWRRQLC